MGHPQKEDRIEQKRQHPNLPFFALTGVSSISTEVEVKRIWLRIQASFVLTGSIGVLIVSWGWTDRILVLGAMILTLGLANPDLWTYAEIRCRVRKHFVC
jgi:hypothetical protein